MADITFTPDDSLYRDRDKLSEDYTPDEIVGRDEEIERYHTALQPVINGEDPNNIFLYGKTGVGKTAVTGTSSSSSKRTPAPTRSSSRRSS